MPGGRGGGMLKLRFDRYITGHYKKIPSVYLRKNLLSTAGNLKENEQTKYKSVPIFLLLLRSCREKARNTELLNF